MKLSSLILQLPVYNLPHSLNASIGILSIFLPSVTLLYNAEYSFVSYLKFIQASSIQAPSLKRSRRAGHKEKTCICFSHFDEVRKGNRPNGLAERNHVLSSLDDALSFLPSRCASRWLLPPKLAAVLSSGII